MINIFDVNCPTCKSICWVNNGDIEDLTVPDVEAGKCWNCKSNFLINSYDIEDDIEDKVIENTYQTASQAASRKYE